MLIYEKNDNPIFVMYDVSDNKLRKKIFSHCEDFGLVNVQFSVFFGYLNPVRFSELKKQLEILTVDNKLIAIKLNIDGKKNIYSNIEELKSQKTISTLFF